MINLLKKWQFGKRSIQLCQNYFAQFPKSTQQLLFFSSIGGTTAIIHLIIVLNLVSNFAFAPLIANIIAFIFAFNMSYLGHRYLTFASLKDEKKLRLPHFFLVAASAGMINELLYFILLNYTKIHYLLALIMVLGLVAVYSFTLSRFWACR